jgi:hypothetical protein
MDEYIAMLGAELGPETPSRKEGKGIELQVLDRESKMRTTILYKYEFTLRILQEFH